MDTYLFLLCLYRMGEQRTHVGTAVALSSWGSCIQYIRNNLVFAGFVGGSKYLLLDEEALLGNCNVHCDGGPAIVG